MPSRPLSGGEGLNDGAGKRLDILEGAAAAASAGLPVCRCQRLDWGKRQACTEAVDMAEIQRGLIRYQEAILGWEVPPVATSTAMWPLPLG
jgi:hypothetical protein